MSSGNGFKVHNANFDKVHYILEKMLQDNARYCGCYRCRMDTAAIALNSLPPHYFVDHSRPESSDMGSHWMLVEVAVKDALERVHRFPNHSKRPKTSAKLARGMGIEIEEEAPDE